MGSNCAIPSKAPTVAANSSPLIQQLPFQQAIELQAPQIPAQKSQRDDLKGLSRTSIVMRPEPQISDTRNKKDKVEIRVKKVRDSKVCEKQNQPQLQDLVLEDMQSYVNDSMPDFPLRSGKRYEQQRNMMGTVQMVSASTSCGTHNETRSKKFRVSKLL